MCGYDSADIEFQQYLLRWLDEISPPPMPSRGVLSEPTPLDAADLRAAVQRSGAFDLVRSGS